MHEQTIADYAEAIEAGATLPPVVVFHDGEQYWLADGFHRLSATKRIGCTDMEVDLRQGTRRDAMLYSFSANANHGLPRTSDDKRRCVMAMLADDDWSAWSNREIARACAVYSRFVDRLRPGGVRGALADSASPPICDIVADSDAGEPASDPVPKKRKVRRAGSEYEMSVEGIGRGERRDPDEELERELVAAEVEVGAPNPEVEVLQAQLTEARETVSELTLELETLMKGADGDLATELKKLVVYVRAVERTRDDYQMQATTLKAEVKRLQRQIARMTGEQAHA